MSRLLLALIAYCTVVPAAAAASWSVQPEASRLGFTVSQQGGELHGRFRAFRAQLRFSPQALASSGFEVTIDVTSITTDSSQVDAELGGEAWFDFERFPRATFRTREIRRADGGDYAYEAVGPLTIRGNRHEVVLPFDWRIDGDTARMQGRVTIDRTRFGVGQGEWAADDTVGRQVTVVVDLTLRRTGG